VVQLLLEKGADVNARGGHYGSALKVAAARGLQKVAQLLMDAGAVGLEASDNNATDEAF